MHSNGFSVMERKLEGKKAKLYKNKKGKKN